MVVVKTNEKTKVEFYQLHCVCVCARVYTCGCLLLNDMKAGLKTQTGF